MTVVLVHGNPETADVWSPLLGALGDTDVLRLSPPGFGAPAPSGWSATPQAYRDWLVAELESLPGPVDLVGHDWGGVHVVAVAMARPDLLRSWCTDSIGLLDADYTWHSLARTWQTRGAGEAAIARLTAPTVDERARYLASIGIPATVAATLAPGCARVDGAVVLELYRSAAQPAMADLGRTLQAAARRPGLVLLADQDAATGTERMRLRAAGLAGAAVEVLRGVGHWWMLQDPASAAGCLRRFWCEPRTVAGS